MGKRKYTSINREISWLSFNERVLQEAADPSVPLIERMRYLGIFSNNLDEFFRVRVATLKRMISLGEKARLIIGEDPSEVLHRVRQIVLRHRDRFAAIHDDIQAGMKKEGIRLLDEKQLNKGQGNYVREYFQNSVRQALVPIMLGNVREFPALKDRGIYLAVKMASSPQSKEHRYALIEIPTQTISRFLILPPTRNAQCLIVLDDVIRYCLDEVFAFFRYEHFEAYTIKLTRDAELDIDDDISRSLVDKLVVSLKNRKVGQPVRFIYDKRMPGDLYHYIMGRMGLEEDENIIPGGRYHNFKDFIAFPYLGKQKLRYPELPPHRSPELSGGGDHLDTIRRRDLLLHYPYQAFSHNIDILREAAIDPRVTTIKITLYRVADRSKVINALVNAVRNGKKVTAVLELRARFDEEANIEWATTLQDEGVEVVFGVEGLKVHSKLILIEREEKGKLLRFAHVGTGNFHEKTARLYSDISIWTADPRISNEVRKVFDFFRNSYRGHRYSHLFVSPINTRRKFMELINQEIRNAKAGKTAYMILKMNNLVDRSMIRRLYQASQAGVRIQLIVRGICSLQCGVQGMSENIEGVSIVDRFLEHARIFVFANGGDEKYFISSADWMVRNLDRRVEVTTPVYSKAVQRTLRDILAIQLRDNTKARILDADLSNDYVHKRVDETEHRAQIELYEYFSENTDKK